MTHLSRPDEEAGSGAESRGATTGALLSSEQSATAARPLRCWSPAARTRLLRTVGAAWREWCEAWGVDADGQGGGEGESGNGARCEPAPDAGAHDPIADFATWQPADEGLWWALIPCPPAGAVRLPRTAGALSLVCRALFGEASASDPTVVSRGVRAESSSTMAAELARAAWEDWWSRLARTSAGAQLAPTSDASGQRSGVMGPWSGALVVTVPFCAHSLRLLLSGERVARMSGATSNLPERRTRPAGALTPVTRALAHRTARVHAELQRFELELGALATLRVGDVLRTTHAVDTAMTVSVAVDAHAGEVVCSGFLGKSGRWRAVELLRDPVPPHEPPASERERPNSDP